MDLAFSNLKGIGDKAKSKRWAQQMGTLGSGNHFIEICLDKKDRVWFMLHSGSRGIGNMIGMHFIAQAKKEMEKQDARLPDKNLSYFTKDSAKFVEYVNAVSWAQDYASENRKAMMASIVLNVKHAIPKLETRGENINCHHNYVSVERHYGKDVYVTRKGAIRARKGEMGIIPGSMGSRSYIIRGKGNPESFESCSHGAGRSMSRTAARSRFSEKDLATSMGKIEYNHRKSIIDEIPSAYKDINQVMDAQKDLVDIVHELLQIVSIKGD